MMTNLDKITGGTGFTGDCITTGTVTTNGLFTGKRWSFCPDCGKSLPADWNNCAGCGKLIGSTGVNPYFVPYVGPAQPSWPYWQTTCGSGATSQHPVQHPASSVATEASVTAS